MSKEMISITNLSKNFSELNLFSSIKKFTSDESIIYLDFTIALVFPEEIIFSELLK